MRKEKVEINLIFSSFSFKNQFFHGYEEKIEDSFDDHKI